MFFIFLLLFTVFILAHPKGKWHAAVMLFVAMIATGPIVPAGQQFLGFLDHRTVACLAVIAVALFFGAPVVRFPFRALDRNKRHAVVLLVAFIVLIDRYMEVKEWLFMDTPLDSFTFFKRLGRDVVYAYAAFLVIKSSAMNPKTHGALMSGLLLGLLFMVPALLFPAIYESLGFVLYSSEKAKLIERSTGVIVEDPNNAAALFNIAYGFLLAHVAREKKFSFRSILIALLLFIGILKFGSRTGFIVFSLSSLVYLGSTSTNPKTMVRNSMALLVVLVGAFYLFGDLLASRLEGQLSGEEDHLSSRQAYWLAYTNDFIEHPEYVLIGNLEPPPINRFVHNTYLYYLFFTGLIPLLLLAHIFWHAWRNRSYFRQQPNGSDPLFLLLPLLVSWIVGGGLMYYWFILFLADSSGLNETVAAPDHEEVPSSSLSQKLQWQA